jgi:hypothetical protein
MANDEDEVQVAYRISKSVARAMDKAIERREKEQLGLRMSRADLSRIALMKLLSDEADATDPNPKRKAG